MLFRDIFVGVPAFAVDLDEAHPPLHQPAGHQALAGHVLRHGVVEAVELLDVLRLLVDVQGLGDGELHAEGQLVVPHAAQQVSVGGMGPQQLLVEPVEQADAGLLSLGCHPLRGCKIHNRDALGAQQGPLAHGRQVAVGVVDGSSLDAAPLIRQDHEGRQVLVLGAQSVDRP